MHLSTIKISVIIYLLVLELNSALAEERFILAYETELSISFANHLQKNGYFGLRNAENMCVSSTLEFDHTNNCTISKLCYDILANSSSSDGNSITFFNRFSTGESNFLHGWPRENSLKILQIRQIKARAISKNECFKKLMTFALDYAKTHDQISFKYSR